MFFFHLTSLNGCPLTNLWCRSFDLQLEKFGVDTAELKKPASHRIFRAWMEDWEKEFLKKNDCVAEAALFEKYKNLVFYDPDTKSMFHIVGMEFHTGRKGGWHLVGESKKNDVDDKPFDIGLAIELIAGTTQVDGVEIIMRQSDGDDSDSGNSG